MDRPAGRPRPMPLSAATAITGSPTGTKALSNHGPTDFQQEFIKPSGAPSADIFEMATLDGKLYVVPGGLTATWGNTWRGAQVFSFIDEEWKTYDAANSQGLDTLRDFVAIAIDPMNSDHFYAGSWYRGMAEFKDESIQQIYNSDNSTLMPNMIEGYPGSESRRYCL